MIYPTDNEQKRGDISINPLNGVRVDGLVVLPVAWGTPTGSYS